MRPALHLVLAEMRPGVLEALVLVRGERFHFISETARVAQVANRRWRDELRKARG